MQINEANRLRLLYFLVFCCTAAWLPIFADFLKNRGISPLNSSLILSVAPLMMFLVQPIYGIFADRLGYKKCMVWATLLAGGSYLLYLFQGGFAYLLSITVLMSLFYNTLQPLLDSLSLRLIQRQPDFSYGTLRVAGAAGWSFMSLLTGRYIDQISTEVIFVFSAGSMLAAFAVALTLRPDEMVQASTVKTEQGKGASGSVMEVLRDPSLLILLLAVFLVSVGATAIWNYYSIYMHENGATATLVGFGLFFQGLCELPLFYFSAKIIGKLGIRTALLLTVFATVLRLLLYHFIKDPQVVIAVELLHGVSWSLFWVVCVEYVNLLVREEWRATGQSLLYAAYFGAGAIVGNFWTGWCLERQWTVGEVFLLNAGIVALTGVLIWAFLKPKASA